MDVDHDGRLDFVEFIAFLMADTGEEEDAPLGRLRSHFQKGRGCSDPEHIHDVVNRLMSWDVDGNGQISAKELKDYLESRQQETDGDSKSMNMQLAMAEAMLEEIEQKTHVTMDMWDFVAGVLGRRKTPVELLIYDISESLTSHFSAVLLGQKPDPIYVLGIVAFGGTEYWYSGEIFRSQPGSLADCLGPVNQDFSLALSPSDYTSSLQVIHLAYTLISMDEFHTYLSELRESKEAYDVSTNSSYHVAEKMLKFLTGKELPEEVEEMVAPSLTSPTVTLLKPFLDEWLGGCEGHFMDGRDFKGTLAAAEGPKAVLCSKTVLKQALIKGTHQAIDDADLVMVEVEKGQYAVAVVTAWKGGEHGNVDVRYYNTALHQIIPKRNVPRSSIARPTL